jgi:hypothetical protein
MKMLSLQLITHLVLITRVFAAADFIFGCMRAKTYKVTFTGLWTQLTHPKNYPTNASWSSLVAASHNHQYQFWVDGGKASNGIKDMAESGNMTALLDEIKVGGDNILDTLVLPGIDSGNGSHSGQLSFDGNHSVVSVITKLNPSPDWFVGIAGLNFCREESWASSDTDYWHPLDAGADSGLQFTSADFPTTPEESISELTGTNSNNATSSYFGYSPSVPAMATMTFDEIVQMPTTPPRGTYILY